MLAAMGGFRMGVFSTIHRLVKLWTAAPPKALPGREMLVPHVFIADDAFALRPNLMKPFPGRDLLASQRIHNYRLSRGRRSIENTFGIMSAKFRVLRSPIHLDALKTRKVTKACCALHNFLLKRNGKSYAPNNLTDRCGSDGTIIDGEWRQDAPTNTLLPLQHEQTNITNDAKKIRKEFEVYYMTTGAVPWQFHML